MVPAKKDHPFCQMRGSSPEVACYTVQITFIFTGQTHLVFGKRVCTCVTKHSNAFRTFLNWLKNLKRVWHEPKLHILRLPLFGFGFSFRNRWSNPFER